MRHTHIFFSIAMFAAFFLSIRLNAQLIKIPIPDKVLMSSYIFEGEVIRKDCYYNQHQDFIYTSYTVHISKIFKGDINCGTIEIISTGGTVGDESYMISHNLDFENGDIGTFLCIPTNREQSAVDFYSESNSLVVEIYGESQGFLRYQVTDSTIRATDAFYSFDSLALVYDMLEFYSQLNYTDCDATIINELQNEIPTQRKKTVTHNTTKSEAYKEMDKSLEPKRNYAKFNSENSANKTQTTTLYYNFENVVINQSLQTIDFDIYLHADDNATYFDGAWVEIPLDPSEFGTDLVQNNRVTVTRGTIMANTNNYNDPLPFDAGILPSTAITIIFGAKWDPPARYNLTTTPEQAIHVKIDLLNCAIPANYLTFTDSASAILNSFYAVNANDSTSATFWYPNIDISDYDNASCYPTITSIYPTTLSAGIGDFLLIKGKYFGTTKAEVSLNNADDGGLTTVKLDANDISTWSDTLILATVPARAEPNRNPVGTGRVKVRPVGGFATTSNNDLTILYNLYDYTIGVNKYHLPLRNAQGNGNYEFYVDDEIANNTNMYKTFAKAMWQWDCETSVDFRMGPTYTWTPDTTRGNDTSQIIIGDLPAGVVMGTLVRTSACSNSQRYVNEIDIIINRDYVTQNKYIIDSTGTVSIPAGKSDFYAAALHELGHSIGEHHVIDENAIMYYAADLMPGFPIPNTARKINVSADISAAQGGDKSVQLSQANTASCVTNITPMLPSNCGTYAVHEGNEYSIIKNLYPNPANNYLNIEIDMPKPSSLNLQIYNSIGQLIKQEQYNTTQNQILTTNISNFPQGIYTISIKTKDYFYTQKFIKE